MLDFLNRWLPIDASAHGAELDSMTALVHWVMLVLFLGWGLYFLFVLFRFRAKRNPQADPEGVKSHFSTWAEGGIALIEGLLLIGFAIPAWGKWVTPPPDTADPIEVRVIGEQFAWNVHYPGPDDMFGRQDVHLITAANPLGLDPEDPMGKDDVVAVNQMRLPVDRPATVLLSSKDVIHSFGLPYFRVKQDAIPGMEIPVHFTPVMVTPQESRLPQCAASKSCWEIACAQLCGLGHFRMRGYITILEKGEFEEWMAAEVAKKMPPPPEPEPAEEAVEGEADGEGAEQPDEVTAT